MSELELTESDLEVGAHVEYTALGGLLGDDETHSGTITELRTKTVQHVSEPDEERTIVVLSDGDEKYEIREKTLTQQQTHESDNSGFRVDSFVPADADEDDDDPEIVTDGGEDVTAHVDDATIEGAIESNDDPDHPDALTVEEVRDLLACVQRSAEIAWSEWMDNVENGHSEVVADTDGFIVLSTGEHDAVAEELELTYEGDVEVDRIAKSVVTQIHHELARERCDYDWSVAYPYVIRKPEGARDGQRYVEAVVNSLMGEGLSPGQAWAVYGVHVLGYSRNKWASMCGYSDHSAISEPLRKAEQKAGHLGLL